MTDSNVSQIIDDDKDFNCSDPKTIAGDETANQSTVKALQPALNLVRVRKICVKDVLSSIPTPRQPAFYLVHRGCRARVDCTIRKSSCDSSKTDRYEIND